MDIAAIHNAILAAGIPLASVESTNGVDITLRFGDGVTLAQQQAAFAIAASTAAAITPDYDRFKALLRGGGLFAAALATTEEQAWAVLLTTVDSSASPADSGRLADFHWALQQVYKGLPTPLTAAQFKELNGHLSACGFGFQLS